MQHAQEQADIHEIPQKGQPIFEALSQKLAETHLGQFVSIEVDSGDYFLGETGIEATRKAQEKFPGKVFFLGRLGYRTAYSFKGRR